MKSYLHDGVDLLIIRPDIDEGKLFCGDKPYYDPYGLYFAQWFGHRSKEYLEWLPER